jgi:hypothetical protein
MSVVVQGNPIILVAAEQRRHQLPHDSLTLWRRPRQHHPAYMVSIGGIIGCRF